MTGQVTVGESEGAPTSSPVVRNELGRFAELSALVGFGVVAPVLGSFGESTETFVSVGASPGDIVRFGLLVTFVPLLALGALATATRFLGERVRGIVQHGLVGLLAGMVATTLVRHADAGAAVRYLVAVVAAAAAVWLHLRWRPGQLFLRYASPAPVFFLLTFLFASPVSGLVNPADVDVDVTGSAGGPPVVLIVLDELPTMSIVSPGGIVDRQLFPNLGRLADQSTWYRDNSTVASRTTMALPSIVTGRYPPTKEVQPVLDNYPDNLLTLLARTHDVHATEWITQFCPRDVCPPGPPDLSDEAKALLRQDIPAPGAPVPELLDEARSLWWEQAWPGAADGPETYTVAGATDPDEIALPGLEFLSGLAEPPSDRPVFDYLHVSLPHEPWRLLPTGDSYDAPHPAVGTEFIGWADSDLGSQFGQAARVRHRLQLQWTDRLVGAIIDRLQELDRWDDAVFVLTADHGVAFTPDSPLRGLMPQNQTEIGWTPLFVKVPGQQEGAVDDTNTMTIDIVPTIAELAGVEVPWEIDGRSVISDPRTDEVKISESGDAERFPEQLEVNRVELQADGLAAIEASGTAESPDPLRIWRAGRHGDLLGRPVDDLAVCPGDPVTVSYRPPANWQAYTDDTLAVGTPLPLWHDGVITSDDEEHDIAAALDGRIVAWTPSRMAEQQNRFGLLLTEPLVRDATGTPELFEIGEDCLRPVPA